MTLEEAEALERSAVLRHSRGLRETARALGQGMLAEIPAGYEGALETLRGLRQRDYSNALKRGAGAVERARERYAYMPESEEGQANIAAIGRGIEAIESSPVGRGWADFTAAAPLAATVIASGAEVVGPKRPKVPKSVTARPQQISAERAAEIERYVRQVTESRASRGREFTPADQQELRDALAAAGREDVRGAVTDPEEPRTQGNVFARRADPPRSTRVPADVVELAEAQSAARSAALRRASEGQMELPGLERTEAEARRQALRDRVWNQTYDEFPNAMNRPAVEAFFSEGRSNPALFEYGAEPPANVRGIEAMAKHFGDEAGERIYVDYRGGDDEPYKIEKPKTHGRGEVMRDRYGDYKYETADPGDLLRDEYGDVKKKEKLVQEELVGPPIREEMEGIQRGEFEPGLWAEERTIEVPRRAEGGEFNYDEEGNPIYRKSRGGEQVYDEHGDPKYTKEENPDYRSDDILELSVSGKGGTMEVAGWQGGRGDEVTVDATGIGKGKGAGALLYQTLLADAVREGYDVGSNSLTGQNALRLLSNTLANYARMGENPRNVSGVSSGRADPVRGKAAGPELWRAEAEETKSRMRGVDKPVDPNRLRFDGEEFTVDGKTVAPDDIMDAIGWRPGEKNIGKKTLMRMAFFDWLRGAPAEDAALVAKNWGKWGPLFGMAGAATALAPLLAEEQETD